MPDRQPLSAGAARIRGRCVTVAATAGLAVLTVAAAGVARTPAPEHTRASASVSRTSPGTGTSATASAAGTSANWAGYSASGAPGQFTSVSASWTQPAVTCGATNTFSSFWAGLDGDGTSTVEQTGTDADCSRGTARYAGWREVFPKGAVFYDNPVRPGDAMTASVTASGQGTVTLSLTDATQGWTRTTRQRAPKARLASAEIVAEAPSDGPVLPLSDFGAVTFREAMVNRAPLGDSGAAPVTMVTRKDATAAAPSPLTGGGTFTVTRHGDGR